MPELLRRALRLALDGAGRWSLAHGALLLVQGVLPLIGLWLMKEIVDGVAAGLGSQDPQAFDGVLETIALAAVVALCGVFARAAQSWVGEGQSLAVHDHVHRLLHEKAAKLDLQDLEDPDVLDLLSRAQQEAPHRPGRVVNGVSALAMGILSVALMGGLLATLDWRLALAVVIAPLPGIWMRARFSRRAHAWQQEITPKDRELRYVGGLLTAPGAAKEVRLFGLGDRLRERYREARRPVREGRMDLARGRVLTELAVQVPGQFLIFGAYAVLAWLVLDGAATLGELVMYAQAVQRVQGAVQQIFGSISGLYEDGLFLAAFHRFLDLEPALLARAGGSRGTAETAERGLAFEGVSFRYPSGGPMVLGDVSFRIAEGERIALVGENGSGKSTILKLICRFYDPTAGRITLDGVDLRDVDPDELRLRMGTLFQDFMRYDFTVAENIAPEAARPEPGRLLAAAEAARIRDRIEALPGGLDCMLGRRFEGGVQLSAGEWQRLALARAYARDPRVLLLDEPTAAIDPRTEAEIVEGFLDIARDRIALMAAHRLSTASRCDRILVLAGGRVVEEGAHEDLVDAGGLYARAWAAQTRNLRPSPRHRP